MVGKLFSGCFLEKFVGGEKVKKDVNFDCSGDKYCGHILFSGIESSGEYVSFLEERKNFLIVSRNNNFSSCKYITYLEVDSDLSWRFT